MKVQRIIAVAVSTLILSACGTTVPKPVTQSVVPAPKPKLDLNDQEAVTAEISVQRDDFKKVINYKGPNASDKYGDQVFLRAWKLDAGSIAYQIYVLDYYDGEWRYYDSAYDSNGVALDTTVISRAVSLCSAYSCSHNEHLGLNVSQGYLEKNQQSGIRFKIIGKAGEDIFFIPSGYIKAFLSATK
ncbi:MAG: hypothetical protein KGZ88_20510 [Methylomicrobium sp.]|nr:hypothetical protein [Methylomicrobium sp.]